MKSEQNSFKGKRRKGTLTKEGWVSSQQTQWLLEQRLKWDLSKDGSQRDLVQARINAPNTSASFLPAATAYSSMGTHGNTAWKSEDQNPWFLLSCPEAVGQPRLTAISLPWIQEWSSSPLLWALRFAHSPQTTVWDSSFQLHSNVSSSGFLFKFLFIYMFATDPFKKSFRLTISFAGNAGLKKMLFPVISPPPWRAVLSNLCDRDLPLEVKSQAKSSLCVTHSLLMASAFITLAKVGITKYHYWSHPKSTGMIQILMINSCCLPKFTGFSLALPPSRPPPSQLILVMTAHKISPQLPK